MAATGLALVLALTAVGPVAAAEDPGRSTAAGSSGEAATIEVGSAARAALTDDVDLTETITFSEFRLGTAITTQYQPRGIVFGGDSPYIETDGANPTSPVLSGTPMYQGAIEGRFVREDGSPRTVNHAELDVGYINTENSVRVIVSDLHGSALLDVPLAARGIVTVKITQAGMASFRVEAVADEPGGFAVDNVTYLSPLAPDVVHVDTYVALGDSFQSGQGAGNYEPGTDEGDGNGCRRSHNAYPHLLLRRGAVALDLDFRACSGAVMRDFSHAQHADQGPQLDALGSDTRLVTVGIGGNDLDFAGVLKGCIATVFGNPASVAVTWWRSCARNQGPTVDAKIASLSDGSLGRDLSVLYREIRRRAPHARVGVVD
jgi:hypothetical protein